MTEYKPGDRVCWAVGGRSEPATVESGPWRSAGGPEFYVVAMPGGWHLAAMAHDLVPAPVRKGDVVSWHGEALVTVETDPVRDAKSGSEMVIVRFEEGDLHAEYVDRLAPYVAPEAEAESPDTGKKCDATEVDGITYRLDRKYRDRYGDVWVLGRIGDTVRAEPDGADWPIDSDSPLWADVVAEDGPMTEVAGG